MGRYERVDSDSEVVRDNVRVGNIVARYEPEQAIVKDVEIIAKPHTTRTEDFIDAIYEAYWYAVKLYQIRKSLKNALSLLTHSNKRIRAIAEMKARELEKEERDIAKKFYEARKKARVLCELKYRESYACEKCIYKWVCWGRIRA